jgi:hypothetical protein
MNHAHPTTDLIAANSEEESLDLNFFFIQFTDEL